MSKTTSCFIHVPKSAGSALIRFLQASLGEGGVLHASEAQCQRISLPSLLERFPLVAGHLTLAQVPEGLLDSAFFFTFLREPVDRVLSLYYYHRQLLAERQNQERRDLNAGLEATLDGRGGDYFPPSPWSNWQTWIFSGAAEGDPRSARELLPAALRNLERLDFVGLHAHFDEGVRHLCARRGWPLADLPERVNVTASRPAADATDPALRARLLELNACDARLYERARALWEAARSQPVGPVAAPAPVEPPTANARAEHGTREIVITDTWVRDARTGRNGVVEQGSRAEIGVDLRGEVASRDVTVGIRLSDELGMEVYGVNTLLLDRALAMEPGQSLRLVFACDLILGPGRYYLTVAIHGGGDHRHERCYHWIDNALAFECRCSRPTAFSGLVDLKASLEVSPGPEM